MNLRAASARTSATEIAKRLGLSARERDIFVVQVDRLHSRSQSARHIATEQLQLSLEKLPTRSLSLDAFQVLSEWYAFAILELLKWKDLEHAPKVIAKHLNLSVLQVKQSLLRLERLGMIQARQRVAVSNSGIFKLATLPGKNPTAAGLLSLEFVQGL